MELNTLGSTSEREQVLVVRVTSLLKILIFSIYPVLKNM